MVEFCNAWDEAVARNGAASVFLPDREGLWRLASDWTRDAWERAPGPHAAGWRWVLFRDHATGFVNKLLVTSPTLLTSHPRGDVEVFDDPRAADDRYRAFVRPPLAAGAP